MTGGRIRTALVTGASAGLGAEFARQLAAAGTALILVARRREKLEALSAELHERHGILVEILPADLAEDEDLRHVERRIATADTLDLLINNAGFGSPGPFSKNEVEPFLAMIQVQVAASVRLTRMALKGMTARGRGDVINVASIAAFSPLSGTVYSAAKAFLVNFSVNLQYELAGTGVRIQALCPGLTHTEFHEASGADISALPEFLWMPARDVARISLKALGRRRVVCIPGLKNRLIAAPMRCAPTAALIRAIASLPYFRRKAGV